MTRERETDMETNDRPAVELTDSLLVEGSVVLAHRMGHKSMSVAVLSREELQAFVQQAHDVYGVTADPFATPGSADALPVDDDPWPEFGVPA